MRHSSFNSRKIFNDPVYGFITIGHPLLFDLIEHPWFQRLRRIRQLGMTDMVYPGALHTRFQHSIGAMYLMNHAINALRLRGTAISDQEALGAAVAILLHDIGHGPFSHALENSIIENIDHEMLSGLYMEKLNESFGGQLEGAISIFENTCSRKFLHQLVSSQLDMDRLEKFIIARRLMYWQVYLHKTVLAAENMLMSILRRAKELSRNGKQLFATPVLSYFLNAHIGKNEMIHDPEVIIQFSLLDDFDIYTAIKTWSRDSDPILSRLCRMLIERQLFGTELQKEAFHEDSLNRIREEIGKRYGITTEDASYFLITDSTENHAYHPKSDKINIHYKSGEVLDIAKASDQLNITVLHKTHTKHFLCYPKEFRDCL
jgi:HD superfamily phosphohydrolase